MRARPAEPRQTTSRARMRSGRRTRPDSTDRVLQYLRVALAQPDCRWCSARTAHRSHQSTADDSRTARCSSRQHVEVLSRLGNPCRDTRLVRDWPSLLSSSLPPALRVPLGLPARASERGVTALPHFRRARLRWLLLAAHSRTAAFQSPGRPTPGTGHHSGRRSASRFRCNRRSCSHVAIRSYPEGLWAVCARLPSGHSLRNALASRFLGAEPRSSPLPVGSVVHGSAPSLHNLTGKPYVFGPLIVELFTVRLFTGTPEWSDSGSACHQAGSSRRQLALNDGARSTEPRRGIRRLSSPHRLRSHRPRLIAEVCQRRPHSARIRTSDRTPGLLSGVLPEDYSDEPPLNRTSDSHRIRLEGPRPRRVVNPVPLARLVRPGLPGGRAHKHRVALNVGGRFDTMTGNTPASSAPMPPVRGVYKKICVLDSALGSLPEMYTSGFGRAWEPCPHLRVQRETPHAAWSPQGQSGAAWSTLSGA